MTSLEWDQLDERRNQAGVSHGVFYPVAGPGVAWNGLLSVDESSVGGDVSEHYIDGVKYLTLVGSTNFQATVTAFSAPREFAPYGGDRPVLPGVSLGKQPKLRFNFAYQTTLGDGDGYLIHMVTNALVSPMARAYQTIGETPTPTNLVWKIDATPVALPGLRPAAHLVVDSTKAPPAMLSALESLLYGTDLVDPLFPSIPVLLALFGVGP